jgi:hypothetical protein
MRGLNLVGDSNHGAIYVRHGGVWAVDRNTGTVLATLPGVLTVNTHPMLTFPPSAQDTSNLYFSFWQQIVGNPWAIMVYGKSDFSGGTPLYSGSGGIPQDIGVQGAVLWWNDNASALWQGSTTGAQSAVQQPTTAAAIAVDSSGLVWADKAGALWTTSATTFGTPRQLLAPAGGVSSAILLDSLYAYFQDGSGTFYRSARDGSILTKLAAATTGDLVYQFAIDNSTLYWADNSAGAIYSVPFSGSQAVTTVATGQSGAFGIVVDSGAIYWSANALMKLAK